ncbi:hypothetical protein BVC71_11695 [Marivivens niveibacter]|uniref:Divergent polysaccharide deacetylase n=1 Tax=Marivivens niveibacter TaxID=1930667 RepID=A0A251WVX6_9RHOB|nr:divergent polysaccharide deacetylase family protein [Marivivens niveibacter]OUD08597.1 hypothetical protein BVC71_11695 [Marivivens niveibacter]
MLKGLFSGVAVGAILSVVGLATASLVAPMPEMVGQSEPEPVVTPADDPEMAAEDPTASVETTDDPAPVVDTSDPVAPSLTVEPETGIQIEAPSLAPAPVIDVPETSAPLADTTTADRPEDVEIIGDMSEPEADDASGVTSPEVDPVLQSPQSVQPNPPSGEADVIVSTDPAAVTVEIIPEPEPENDQPDMPMIVAPEMGMITAPDANEPETTAPMAEPEAAPIDTSVRPAPGLSGQSASALPTGDSTVTIRRLGTDSEPAVTETAAINALEDYSAPFSNAGNLPLMSFVVMDEGGLPNGPAVLASIPFDVTVALSIADPDAEAKMSAYRAAGFEVLIMNPIPQGATASDAAQVIQGSFSILPEAIGILDLGEAGLGSNRNAIEVVMSELARAGRGYVALDSGLNSGMRAAETADVPATLVSRDLDGDGQGSSVIRRFIDNGAFQARQQSGVVMLARLRADTVSALTLWSTANRASQVALAPVSAVLKSD